jgi:hypothetical protein
MNEHASPFGNDGVDAVLTFAARETTLWRAVRSTKPDAILNYGARCASQQKRAADVCKGSHQTMSATRAAFLGSGRRMRATVAPPTTVNRGRY